MKRLFKRSQTTGLAGNNRLFQRKATYICTQTKKKREREREIRSKKKRESEPTNSTPRHHSALTAVQWKELMGRQGVTQHNKSNPAPLVSWKEKGKNKIHYRKKEGQEGVTHIAPPHLYWTGHQPICLQLSGKH